MRGVNLIWTALILIVAVALFVVKYEVQHLESQLLETNQEITQQKEEIHVLNAEWTYLNDPKRLAELSRTHLGLVHLGPDRIIGIERLPEAERPSQAALRGVQP